MVVKTYTARNATDAMAQIQRDLGPEAVILRSKVARQSGLKGLFGAKVVRVTAAVDAVPKPAQTPSPAPTAAPVGTRPASGRPAPRPDTAAELVALLKQNEVEEGIARRIAQAAIRVHTDSSPCPAHELRGSARQAIEALLRVEAPIAPRAGGARVIALTGPRGVGKTTTAAKLAARFAAEIGPDVAVIRADRGTDRMRFGPEGAQVPVERAHSPAELRRTVDRHAHKRLVLIDTMGRSPLDAGGVNALADMLRAVPEAEPALTISATTKAGSLIEIAEAYAAIEPTRLVLTKIDETRCIGPLLALCARHPIPLTYVTTGPNVPDDIEPADSTRLSELILPEPSDGAGPLHHN